MRTKFEVADVIRQVDISKYSKHQQKAFRAILDCRTEKLGGHARVCTNEECGNVEIAYNSCRNRCCPKCGWKKQQDWIIKLANNMFAAKHFHTVFTIPHEFNNFYLYNKSAFSNLLFKASSKALLDLIKTKWKAKGGYTAVLHTWGSNLSLHPHVHMIVPAGGLCVSTGKWIGFRKQYLANRTALALRFRNLFMKGIKKMIRNGSLVVPSCHACLNNDASLLDFFEAPHSKSWNVFVKKTFGGEVQVIKYLGRYVHRIAISNSRIKNVADGNVTFQYKDYKRKNFNAQVTMTCLEFARRIAWHCPDKGFARVRHGGICANSEKEDAVLKSRVLVYGEASQPVCVLKEVYKVERKVLSFLDSISICQKCSCEVEATAPDLVQSSA